MKIKNNPLLHRCLEYHILESLKGKIIDVEGLIGAGKSSAGPEFVEYLKSIGFDAVYLKEKINKKYLDIYYSNFDREAFGFQINTILNRINVYEEARRWANKGYIVFVDRGLLGDFSFAKMQRDAGLFDDAKWNAYMEEVEKARCYEVSIVLLLDCTPETARKRIEKRGIESEIKGCTLEYLTKLKKATDETIATYHNGPLVCLDWNEDLTASGTSIFELSEIRCFKILHMLAKECWMFYYNKLKEKYGWNKEEKKEESSSEEEVEDQDFLNVKLFHEPL